MEVLTETKSASFAHPQNLDQANIGKHQSINVDAKDLAAELRKATDAEVRFDNGSRALYSTDGSNYRQVPIGVVIPRSKQDVIQTVALCRRFGAPVLSRGGGTSLAGQCCNVAVVMDFSKYLHQVLELDTRGKLARVEPGCVLDNLRERAEQFKLTFGPDPATHNHNTLGGMIGNDSCGVHSVMAGAERARTADNIESLEVLTYDGLRLRVGPVSEIELDRIIREGGRLGEIYDGMRRLRDKYGDEIRRKFPRIPRRVSGYNIDELLPEKGFNVARALAGSEGTLVTYLEATLQLIYSPPARSVVLLGYPDVYTAADHITEVMAQQPTGCEGLDDLLVKYMQQKNMHVDYLRLLPPGGGWLLVEFGGENKEESDAKARKLMHALNGRSHAPSMKLFDDKTEEEHIWKVREGGLGATARIPGHGDAWPGWEDSAVPPEKVGAYLRDLRKLFDKYGYDCSLYGHFGQGCIHVRIDFDLYTADGIKKYMSFTDEAADLVVGYGGSLSGEHGDGQARAQCLPRMFGNEIIQAFREFKSIWDPEWKMNPGKVVDAYGADENLRLGTSYNPWEPETHFTWPDDNGRFSRAVLRCVGVGECRREHGATMCPSYRVTHEEKHSTRGRARLLFEMLQGEVISGWRSEAVRDALDLCLACKGCKGDCPVSVDMATYKAEFFSHYYARRLRPVHAYSIGLIHWWARIASKMPRLVNGMTQSPGLRSLSKFLGGFAQKRRIPPFAPYTLRQAYRERQLARRRKGQAHVERQRGPVILWPDTFNNYFYPSTGEAALNVLEALGFDVQIPRRALCCGRPLYDYGMLDLAERLLDETLETLRPQIREGVPIVVLEPSCAAVFRDELTSIKAHDEDAKRLSGQTYLLSEFLEKKVPDYQPPALNRKAIVHGHCHHKAVMKMKDEEGVLKKMHLDYELLDSGCCGMAGGFGFEKEHYGVSVAVGEEVLLPAVRKAQRDTIIIANGFSCREQIEQATERRALHLAQVLEMGMREGPDGPNPGAPPESSYPNARKRPVSKLKLGLALTLGVLAGGAVAWGVRKLEGT